MNKISEIFQAWVAAANPTPVEKEIAEYRSGVCDSCEHKTYTKALNIYTCGLCECVLSKKVFSPAGPEACPDKRWEK